MRRRPPSRTVTSSALIAGTAPRLRRFGRTQMRLVGMFVPPVREMVEMLYEFEQDWVVDHSGHAALLGDHATPLDAALAATMAGFQPFRTLNRLMKRRAVWAHTTVGRCGCKGRSTNTLPNCMAEEGLLMGGGRAVRGASPPSRDLLDPSEAEAYKWPDAEIAPIQSEPGATRVHAAN